MLKCKLLGKRHGRATIHWLGVIAATLVISVIFCAGTIGCNALLGRGFSMGLIELFVLFMFLLSTIGLGIERALKRSPESLQRLD